MVRNNSGHLKSTNIESDETSEGGFWGEESVNEEEGSENAIQDDNDDNENEKGMFGGFFKNDKSSKKDDNNNNEEKVSDKNDSKGMFGRFFNNNERSNDRPNLNNNNEKSNYRPNLNNNNERSNDRPNLNNNNERSNDRPNVNNNNERSNYRPNVNNNEWPNDRTIGNNQTNFRNLNVIEFNENNERVENKNYWTKWKIILFGFFNILLIFLLLFYTEFLCDCSVRFNKTALFTLLIGILPFILFYKPKSSLHVNLSVLSSIFIVIMILYLFLNRVRVRFYLYKLSSTDEHFVTYEQLEKMIKERDNLESRFGDLDTSATKVLSNIVPGLASDIAVIVLGYDGEQENGNFKLDKEKFVKLLTEDTAEKAGNKNIMVPPVIGLNWYSELEELNGIKIICDQRYSDVAPRYSIIIGVFSFQNKNPLNVITRELYDFNTIVERILVIHNDEI